MSAARRSLADVLPAAAPTPAAEQPPQRPTATKKPSPRPQRRTAPQDRGVPMYATLEAKQARLRTDQREELATLARRLERARPTGEAERITDNTLIRVAIDLLLEVGGRVDGVTEEEMRASARRLLSTPA